MRIYLGFLFIATLSSCTTQKPLKIAESAFINGKKANVIVQIPFDFFDYGVGISDFSVRAAFFHGRNQCPDIMRTALGSPGLLGRTVLTPKTTKQSGLLPADEYIYVYIEFSERNLAYSGYCGNGFRFMPKENHDYIIDYFPSKSGGLRSCAVKVSEASGTVSTIPVTDILFAERVLDKDGALVSPFGANLCSPTK